MRKFGTAGRALFKAAVFVAAFVPAVPFLLAGAEASCIVSGDITRNPAVSESSEFEAGSWFDSSSFAIEITPCLHNFDSYPNGVMIILR